MHIFDDFVIVLLFGRSLIMDYLLIILYYVTLSFSSSLLLIDPLRDLSSKFSTSHRLVQVQKVERRNGQITDTKKCNDNYRYKRV